MHLHAMKILTFTVSLTLFYKPSAFGALSTSSSSNNASNMTARMSAFSSPITARTAPPLASGTLKTGVQATKPISYGKQTFSDFRAKIAAPFNRYQAIAAEIAQNKFRKFAGKTEPLSGKTQERLEEKAFQLTGQRMVSYFVFNDNPALCAVMANGGTLNQHFILDYVICDSLKNNSERDRFHRENLASGKSTGTEDLLEDPRLADETKLRSLQIHEAQLQVFH